ncbi:MAG: PEP-CTERM sorting domain-containing protein [Nitrospiraceae bacterium]|nr:PEP-CTERM sorting domain-containing protein [Nitrospiraceae bacterium]MDA8090343.1 PEP-CTERM sorting domain-containing protein [Nitrospiraceae bacterium]
MRKTVLLVLSSILVVAFASSAWAQFINGGFETGDFTGWTKNGGYWYGGIGTYNYTGDPGKSAIVTPGLDPIVGHINQVYSGNYAARVNDGDSYYTGWGGYHFSTISQSVVWTEPNIYFAWAAVLEEPGHDHDHEPHFYLTLTDDTTNTTLYNVLYASDTIPASLLNTVYIPQTGDDWKYTDWQVVNLDTSAVEGDTLTLTLLAADCGYGGHSGYVYLDGFGAAPPSPSVPEPATFFLFGTGITGFGLLRRKLRK